MPRSSRQGWLWAGLGVCLLAAAVAWWLHEPAGASLEQAARTGSSTAPRSSRQPGQATGANAVALPTNAAAGPGAADTATPEWLAQPGAPRRRVAGIVTSSGAPVANATVRLVPQRFLPGAQVRVTDGDGRFDFGEQLPMTYSVGASADGRAPASLDVDLANPKATPPPDALELRLFDCTARLTGAVSDPAGNGIASARVAVGLVQEAVAQTDATGHYELCVPPGNVTVRLSAEGFGGVRVNLLARGRTRRDFVLQPVAFVVGRTVLGSSETPVPRALVTVSPAEFTADGATSSYALSDAEGRFRISVAPGQKAASARAAGLRTASAVQVTASSGLLSESVTLRLEPVGRLSGHVKQRGTAVAGAKVIAVNKATNNWSTAGFSQDDGSFVVDGVEAGELTFTARPWEVLSPKRLNFTGGASTVELEVKGLGGVSGVVTRQGQPVEDAEVSVTGGDTWPRFETADAKGHYAVLGLHAGTWKVSASSNRAGAYVEEKTVTLADQEQKTVDLELDSAASIEGTVVDQDGKPVVGVTVVYSLPSTRDQGVGVTDADGRFRCDQMTGGGAYRPRVSAEEDSEPAFKPASGAFEPVTLADGNAHVEGVVLRVRYERLRISGRVLDVTGQLLPDARVQAAPLKPGEAPYFDSWISLPSAATDDQGQFTIDALPAGDYALKARSAEGDEATVPKVAAGASGVTITVQRSGVIEGTLAGFERTPAVRASRVGGDGALLTAQVSGAGFNVRAPAGSYIVTAMVGQLGDAQRAEVRSGETTKLTLTNRGTGVVNGSVIEHGSRAPVPNMKCFAAPSSGGISGPGVLNLDTAPSTDARGAFTIDPSPAGEVAVDCGNLGGEWTNGSAQLTVQPGGHATAAIEVVRRGGSRGGDIGVTFSGSRLPLTVESVTPGGSAARAGVAPGDVVVALDGVPLGAVNDSGVLQLIANHAPGSALTLGLLRGGAPKTVTVVVGTRAP